MRIKVYKRLWCDEKRWFAFHTSQCSCIPNYCGKDVRKTGYSIYTPLFLLLIYWKPKGCNAPF